MNTVILMLGKAPIRGEFSSPWAKKNINVDAAQFKNTRINNQDTFNQKDKVVIFSGKISNATEIVFDYTWDNSIPFIGGSGTCTATYTK